MKPADQVLHNVQAHDRIAGRYDAIHLEIFNPIEQARLRDRLRLAVSWIGESTEPRTALDFGCGSGNLTRHLIEAGLTVTAADVSARFLETVRSRFGHTGRLAGVLQLNGQDLREIGDDTFDMAAAYSVLHHVPDYLGIVAEMARVVRPGGVIYLDHEVNESYWQPTTEYREFLRRASRVDWRKYLTLSNYLDRIRRIFNPRYSSEGDIHVWPDDRIEWPRIEQTLVERGFEILLREDYLLYRRHYRPEVYHQYKDRCSDMRLLIARKRIG